MKINRNYLSLKENYLFADISRKVAEYMTSNPDATLIRLGIGDVTLPLCPAVTEAMKDAVDEMGIGESFRGYGPYEGYDFLREALCESYKQKGVSLEADEVFVSDGAKCDVSNILDILAGDNVVLIPDPVYPVYLDTNIMDGRTIRFCDATTRNGFLPLPDSAVRADIIYLCSPNNPTGAVYTRRQLAQWVDYAREQEALILFDAAYEAFIQDPSLPRSIYEIPGAQSCAVEIGSFSKTAGFTGTRCGWCVVPRDLTREGVRLHQLWMRRQSTKFNGVSYIVQRGAAAVFTEKGRRQIHENIDMYMGNAKIIAQTMREKGITYFGGDNSPYIWLQCPEGMTSWQYFDVLLETAGIVGTPGSGFGGNGEGFFRLTAFGSRVNTVEAMDRFKNLLSC
ncbi:MAG: LL-diaminopimelate aminotransferase [Peptococcaceae bacterium]|nr:LL-diaminopimelate aminotransferase [Peptococcaceae bacterium]